MTAYLTRIARGFVVVGLLLGPIGASLAQQALPPDIQATLSDAAAEGNDALLEAVAAATEANPELAQEIVNEATKLNPDLAEEIVAAAAAAGGDVEIVPAVGPAIPPVIAVLAGVGAAGGGVAAIAGGAGGGGDGDGDAAAAPPPPPPPPPFQTDEYNAQEGLGLVNADIAYERGFTGQGVIVAVIDSGLDVTHPEFAGRVAPDSFDFVDNTADMTDPFGHGTLVSGIIAANKDDIGMHGIAYDSLILPLRVFDSNGVFVPDDAGLAAVIEHAVANGAAVMNNSWGIPGTPVSAVNAAFVQANFPLELAAYQNAIGNDRIIVFAAGNDGFIDPSIHAGLPLLFPELEGLWVAAMAVDLNGNEPLYTNRCGVAAAWCIAAPGGGDAAGSGVNSTLSGGGYGRASGTSFAAPHVSGALAVILQLFQGLTPQEAVVRLFVSADSSGIYADASIFGHGLLDLEAATRPIGTIFVLTGDTLSGPAFTLNTTKILLGTAFGDGLGNSLRGLKLTVFDSYNAPFSIDLGAFVQQDSGRLGLQSLFDRFGETSRQQTAAFGFGEVSFRLGGVNGIGYPATTLGRALKPELDRFQLVVGGPPKAALEELSFTHRFSDASEMRFNYNTYPGMAFGAHADGTVSRATMLSTDAFAAPYLAFGERGYNVATVSPLPGVGTLRLGSFFGESDAEGAGKTFGAAAELAVAVTGRAKVSLQLGMMSERETFLGSRTEGAFDIKNGVPTYFAGLSGEIALSESWKLVGSTYAGLSRPRAAEASLFAEVSPILTQSFSLGLFGKDVLRDGDRMGFIANQPLRVVRGSAKLALPSRRDRSGNIFSDTVTADLRPAGRELDIEALYGLKIAEDMRLTASAMLRLEPGHFERAGPEGVFMLRLEHKF